jgi:hypothetical protein
MRVARPLAILGKKISVGACWLFVLCSLNPWGTAQTSLNERTFPQSKAAVEKALKKLQSVAAGRLPTLDGFAAPGNLPLDRYQRGFFQCTTEVVGLPSGQSRVRVSAKITAWYADSVPGKSGYQVLPSNGRLESDFLDQLQEALAAAPGAEASSVAVSTPATTPAGKSVDKADASAPAISAPTPQDTVPGEPIVGSKKAVNASPFNLEAKPSGDQPAPKAATNDHAEALTTEAKNLEEILRNQSHPNNLVAVKKSGTPVMVNPNEGAKVLFRATAEDEFEMLEMNASWVHVRISGISRGWILRSSVQMPDESDSEPEPQPQAAPAAAAAQNAPSAPADTATPAPTKGPFEVEKEEIASFPGEWEPLRGKTVKIISVQESKGGADQTTSQAKLEYAKSLFNQEYVELRQSSTTAAGVVVVFDVADGGMMAATLPVIEQWKAGALSDEALWNRCYFDPPETFRSSATP